MKSLLVFAPDLEIQTCFFKSNQKSCQIPPLLSSILVLKRRLRKFLSAGLWSSQGDLISLQCFSICLKSIPDNFQKGSTRFIRIQLSPKYFSQKVLKYFHVPSLDSVDKVADGELNVFKSFCFLPPPKFCILLHDRSVCVLI